MGDCNYLALQQATVMTLRLGRSVLTLSAIFLVGALILLSTGSNLSTSRGPTGQAAANTGSFAFPSFGTERDSNPDAPLTSGLGSCPADEVLQRRLQMADTSFRKNIERFNRTRNRWRYNARKAMAFVADVLVPTYPCPGRERLGHWAAGGRWVCLTVKRLRESHMPVVVTVARHLAANETSFESDVFRQWGAVSHFFSPSLTLSTYPSQPSSSQGQKGALSGLDYVQVHSAGLAGTAEVEELRKSAALLQRRYGTAAAAAAAAAGHAEVEGKTSGEAETGSLHLVTLQELLAQVGERHIDILSLDCEGCEHAVVADLSTQWQRDQQPIGQLIMELHDVASLTEQAAAVVNGLVAAGYRLFQMEQLGEDLQRFMLSFVHESRVVW